MELQLIQSKIHIIKDRKVILDKDLAALYGVETRVLKQAVRRNTWKRWSNTLGSPSTNTHCFFVVSIY